jgi:hypothetical protein
MNNTFHIQPTTFINLPKECVVSREEAREAVRRKDHYNPSEQMTISPAVQNIMHSSSPLICPVAASCPSMSLGLDIERNTLRRNKTTRHGHA